MLLECIFFAKFDNILGPTVIHQTPEHFPASIILKTIPDYVICPPLLCDKIISVATGAKKQKFEFFYFYFFYELRLSCQSLTYYVELFVFFLFFFFIYINTTQHR